MGAAFEVVPADAVPALMPEMRAVSDAWLGGKTTRAPEIARLLAPLWSRAGATLFQHGEHFYNFQGLRTYASKFDPAWEPRYLAGPRSPLALPAVLVAAPVSGILAT